jgi:rhamnulokinase
MLAVDLGAETGRAVLGWAEDGVLQTEEIRRFPNAPVHLPDGLHWNILSLYREIRSAIDDAMAACDTTGLDLVSVGIDGWGVDYGLIDRRGALVGIPYHYRDTRSHPMARPGQGRISEQALYAETGVPSTPVNTRYQLLDDADAGRLDHADCLLMIPDLLGYWLTGVKTAEETIASTTQLFDPVARAWSPAVIEACGFPRRIFPDIARAGSVRGRIIAQDEALSRVQVINVASHDTACAFAAADTRPGTMVISAGTWFLVGSERAEPIRTPEALARGFTNELGYGGQIRFIKNCCGLWLLQEARRSWERDGHSVSYANLAERASVATPLQSLIDPDDPRLAPPGPMIQRIADACRERCEPVPGSMGEVVRCIIDSLAMCMRQALDDLVQVTGEPIDQIAIVGGGTKSTLLCQAIADATAIGNLLIQGITNGFCSNLADARSSMASHTPATRYEPAADREPWEAAYRRFRR